MNDKEMKDELQLFGWTFHIHATDQQLARLEKVVFIYKNGNFGSFPYINKKQINPCKLVKGNIMEDLFIIFL